MPAAFTVRKPASSSGAALMFTRRISPRPFFVA